MTKKSLHRRHLKRPGRTLAFFLLLGGLSLSVLSFYGSQQLKGERPSAETTVDISVDESVEFCDDYLEGLRQGAVEGKPILLFFMEDACPFSRRALKETFSDAGIVDLSHRFVCVEIDISRPQSESIMKTYGVTGSPTVQFVSSRGDVLQQIDRLPTITEFKKQMEVVLHSVAWHPATSLLR